jgi:hypothetical protein
MRLPPFFCAGTSHDTRPERRYSLRVQLLINALIAGSFAALLAGGLSLVYGVLGVFNLALGQLALVGGYSTWWLYQQAHVPLVVAIVLGIANGALITWISFELFVAPYYQRHRFLPLVTTIALSMILDGTILLLFQERPRSILAAAKRQYTALGASISMEQAVLKVGGTLRISVPDFERILDIYKAENGSIEKIEGPLLGGQNYAYNFHMSVFNKTYLSKLLREAGFTDIREWDPKTALYYSFSDWASKSLYNKYPISLNLEATKHE